MTRHLTSLPAARLVAGLAAALTLATAAATPAAAHHRGERADRGASKSRAYAAGDKRRDAERGHRGQGGGKATGRKIG